MWTGQEGGGRPLTKGTGGPLADPDSRLAFPRNFNRVSAPDANSCAGCHNLPRSGGAGDIVANVFVLAQRFDGVTFDPTDTVPTRGSVDESGKIPTLDQLADSRATTGMFGGGYLEMTYFHHGKYTTLREAILAHAGEAQAVTDAFLALSDYEQGSIIEFLKTLQVLPEGTEVLVVDQDGHPRSWPPPWAR